jgi:hypothetical protein
MLIVPIIYSRHRLHDTRHNDTQYNDSQHNEPRYNVTQHTKYKKRDIQHNNTQNLVSFFWVSIVYAESRVYYCFAECRYAECHYAACRGAFSLFLNYFLSDRGPV